MTSPRPDWAHDQDGHPIYGYGYYWRWNGAVYSSSEALYAAWATAPDGASLNAIGTHRRIPGRRVISSRPFSVGCYWDGEAMDCRIQAAH